MFNSKFLFRRLFFVCALLLVLVEPVSAAVPATLHAVVIGDTNSDLKRQSAADLAQVEKSVHFLARSLNLKTNLTVLQGKKAKKQAVLEALNNIPVGKEDLVLFYFTGHGFRLSNRTIWPSIHFSADKQYIELDSVVAHVAKKRPRFALVIADCCNVSSSQYRKAPKGRQLYLQNAPRTELNGDLKKLFLKSSGILVISSSSPGEFSCATDFGGLFTCSFLDTFGTRINKPLRNWDEVMQVVASKTRGVQTPQYHFY
jgi:hypothetical protein